MILSIVIPTLNERYYIGKLLESLANQTLKDFEVIVADGSSSDDTVGIVKSFSRKFKRLTVVTTKKRNVAHQRNLGAKKAGSDYILFLDADVILKDKDFLSKVLNKIKLKGVDCAVCRNLPTNKKLSHRFFYLVYNFMFFVTQFVRPVAGGANIFIRKDAFKKAGGFDESIEVGEDIEFLQRLKKKGFSYKFFLKPQIHVSPRRLYRDGVLGYTKIFLHGSFHYLFKGPVRDKNVINYQLGSYDESVLKKDLAYHDRK